MTPGKTHQLIHSYIGENPGYHEIGRWTTDRKISRSDFLASVIAGVAAVVLKVDVKHAGTMDSEQGLIDTVRQGTTYLGNSLPGIDGQTTIQAAIGDLIVGDDGAVYATAIYDESGRMAQVYRDGAILYKAGHTDDANTFNLFHSGGRGGSALAFNSTYAYFCQYFAGVPDTPPMPQYYVGIGRYSLATRGGSLFANGLTNKEWFLPVLTLDWSVHPDGSLSGLAASDSRVYASDPFNNLVRMFNAGTMAAEGTFPVTNPGHMALDNDGFLWVVSGTTIHKYDAAGTYMNVQITDAGTPGVLNIARGGTHAGRLVVSDIGTRQQILFYNTAGTPAIQGTFGEAGGIYSGTRGLMGPLRFNVPAGGVDAAGNVYVNSGGSGTDLRKFTPAGALVWRLYATIFLDTGVLDPTNENRIYTVHNSWDFDYNKPAGQEATWRAHTLDRLSYPNDPRANEHLWVKPSVHSVRVLGGQKFVIVTDQQGTNLGFYRVMGEVLELATVFDWSPFKQRMGPHQPSSRYIWRDKNGNMQFDADEFENGGWTDQEALGWDVDTNGDVWHCREFWPDQGGRAGDPLDAVRRFPYGGLDAQNNPIYSYATVQHWAAPAQFVVVCRCKYIAAADTLYLSGYTPERLAGSPPHRQRAGSELMRIDGWLAGNRTPSWRMNLPYTNTGDISTSIIINAWDVVGERIFVGHLNGYIKLGVPQPPAYETIAVHRTSDGVRLGALFPGAAVGQNANWIDMSYGVRAFQRASGDYMVFAQDVTANKTIVYHGAM